MVPNQALYRCPPVDLPKEVKVNDALILGRGTFAVRQSVFFVLVDGVENPDI